MAAAPADVFTSSATCALCSHVVPSLLEEPTVHWSLLSRAWSILSEAIDYPRIQRYNRYR